MQETAPCRCGVARDLGRMPAPSYQGHCACFCRKLKLQLDHLQMRIDEADRVIKKTAGDNEACRRLVSIPGIGPIRATANHRRHRQRSSVQIGARVRSLARHRAGRIHHRGQAKAARVSKPRDLLLAETLRARCSRRPATEREAIFPSERVVGSTHDTYSP